MHFHKFCRSKFGSIILILTAVEFLTFCSTFESGIVYVKTSPGQPFSSYKRIAITNVDTTEIAESERPDGQALAQKIGKELNAMGFEIVPPEELEAALKSKGLTENNLDNANTKNVIGKTLNVQGIAICKMQYSYNTMREQRKHLKINLHDVNTNKSVWEVVLDNHYDIRRGIKELNRTISRSE